MDARASADPPCGSRPTGSQVKRWYRNPTTVILTVDAGQSDHARERVPRIGQNRSKRSFSNTTRRRGQAPISKPVPRRTVRRGKRSGDYFVQGPSVRHVTSSVAEK